MSALKLTNNSIGRLAANVAIGDTSISLVAGDGAKFPSLTAGDYFPATLVRGSDGAVEIVKVTARSTDTLTVTRAQESTSAKAFVAGDRIELRMTAGTFQEEIARVETATATHAATSKATPVDADEIPLVDSEASSSLKKLTWANIKSYLKSYFWSLTQQPTMRNKIINGDMRIDQRNGGASQTVTAGAAMAYTIDRFYAYCTGANITGQRVAGPIANTFRYRFTGAASNSAVGFGTRLEAENTAMMAGSTVTLQAKLSSSSLTSITWTAYYANTKDTFGTLASPTRTQIATGTFTINSTEATYSAQISIPAAATTGIEIVFTGGALLGSQTLTIGDVQLELGTVVTPFEYRPYATELTMCQRFYEVVSSTVSNNLTVWNPSYTYQSKKRASPTISGITVNLGSGADIAAITYDPTYSASQSASNSVVASVRFIVSAEL